MIAEELINYSIDKVSPDTSVYDALELMHELNIDHLPVVDETNQFKGFIAESLLIQALDAKNSISNIPKEFENIFIHGNRHALDVFKAAQHLAIDFLPVLKEDQKYLGVIDLKELVHIFTEIDAFAAEGGILIISLATKDYSLSEISRILESEGGKILGCFLNNTGINQYELTIKTDTDNLNPLISALERYKYKVVEYYNNGTFKNETEDRLNGLFRYLDI